MIKILVVSDNSEKVEYLSRFFKKHSWESVVSGSESDIFDKLKNGSIDLVIYDGSIKSLELRTLVYKTKILTDTRDIRSIFLVSKDFDNYDLLKYANSFIEEPINENLFLATIKSELLLRENLIVLSKNNDDLAKSLYQLNVLYNTSSQLAGSLDKIKLIDIMSEGLDQSLSLSLSYILVMNEPNDIRLMIKSLYPISQRLENSIKQSALANYNNTFSMNLSVDDIKVETTIKDRWGEFDMNVFSFDSLFAPISIQNKFFGVIEVFRESDFSTDDTKCFTTLVKQVSLPLESAILYDEIKEQNEKLEKLERVKSNFISIVSHELRTPMTVINSSLEILLKGGNNNPTEQKFLGLAKNNADRLSVIIKDLLDLQKMEAGEMEFRFELTNINIPIELVKNSLSEFAKNQKVEINMSLEKGLESVYIDTKRLEQVLTNLISNAIKFTSEGGQINVTTSKMTKEDFNKFEFFDKLPKNLYDEYIKISVEDNGIGIAKENWHKVFEQFKQIENSLTRKVGGSGLGLSIAKQLIERHEGLIWLDSELDKGTTFYVAIPVKTKKDKE
ncbi:hypothetical protein IKQ26_01675 [bacterium]|nr:hypothetical protein [bacterium]